MSADDALVDEPTDDSSGDTSGATEDEGSRFDVGGFIRSQRELAEMSLRRLSELADVSNPYLSQIERGLRKPSAEVLQQVAQALKISVETLYVRAGILPADDRRVSTVPEAIQADPALSPEQRTALLGVYHSFVR